MSDLLQTQKIMMTFDERLDWLSKMGGTGTSLISLYLPGASQLSDHNALLKQEMASATNIKNKRVKINVQCALKSIQQGLKLHKNIPENGLAIFAGEIKSYI